MERKGISPLIAAVLLIAFTMAVASLFAQWAPQLIKSAQGDTKNQSQEIQRCSGIGVSFVQTDFSADVATVTLQQTRGDTAIGELSVTWFYSGSTGAVQNTTSIDSPRGTVQVSRNEIGGQEAVEEVRVSPTGCEGSATATYTP